MKCNCLSLLSFDVIFVLVPFVQSFEDRSCIIILWSKYRRFRWLDSVYVKTVQLCSAVLMYHVSLLFKCHVAPCIAVNLAGRASN